MQVCKGFCNKVEVKKINPKDSGMYDLGYKRCKTCDKFVEWDEPRCPCCGTLLRNKPKNSHLRKKFEKNKMVSQDMVSV